MDTQNGRRPGDYIIDKYMPTALPEERARAHENLRTFLKAMLRVAVRRAEQQSTGVDSEESDSWDTIRSTPKVTP